MSELVYAIIKKYPSGKGRRIFACYGDREFILEQYPCCDIEFYSSEDELRSVMYGYNT